MENLPLQIGKIDNIAVRQPEGANPSRYEVQRRRGSEATCPNDKNLGILQFLLALAANFTQNHLTAIAINL
jgi:hypothetical protein